LYPGPRTHSCALGYRPFERKVPPFPRLLMSGLNSLLAHAEIVSISVSRLFVINIENLLDETLLSCNLTRFFVLYI